MDENVIKSKVEDGYYSNATELVRDAVRRLRELEDVKHNRLSNALELGDKAVREGRTLPYDSQLLEQIEREARDHASLGSRPNPDVCPCQARA